MNPFTPGMIVPLEGSMMAQAIVFQWNPNEIMRRSGAHWVPIFTAGRALPYYEYTRGEEGFLRFRLRFSSRGKRGFVDAMLAQCERLVLPTVPVGQTARPPKLKILLGVLSGIWVADYVDTQRHTKADPVGLTWRFGDANMTFKQVA